MNENSKPEIDSNRIIGLLNTTKNLIHRIDISVFVEDKTFEKEAHKNELFVYNGNAEITELKSQIMKLEKIIVDMRLEQIKLIKHIKNLSVLKQQNIG